MLMFAIVTVDVAVARLMLVTTGDVREEATAKQTKAVRPTDDEKWKRAWNAARLATGDWETDNAKETARLLRDELDRSAGSTALVGNPMRDGRTAAVPDTHGKQRDAAQGSSSRSNERPRRR